MNNQTPTPRTFDGTSYYIPTSLYSGMTPVLGGGAGTWVKFEEFDRLRSELAAAKDEVEACLIELAHLRLGKREAVADCQTLRARIAELEVDGKRMRNALETCKETTVPDSFVMRVIQTFDSAAVRAAVSATGDGK